MYVVLLWYYFSLRTHIHTHTFPLHSHGQTLLIAAVLAAIALAFIDQTLLAVPACVGQVFSDGPLKETFAPLTAVHTIVFSCIHNSTKTHSVTHPIPSIYH